MREMREKTKIKPRDYGWRELNMSFRFIGEPCVLMYLLNKKKHRELSSFVNKAVNFYYRYLHFTEQFYEGIFYSRYELCKHLLRKVGSKIKREIKNEKKMSSL